MNKVSVYIKGDRNSTAYYRIYQYFDKINNIDFCFRRMYPHWMQARFMPASYHSLALQVFLYIYVFFRVLFFLLKDAVCSPSVLVVQKRLITRHTPFIYNCILRIIVLRGTKLIWDFDDHLTAGKEMSVSTFNFMAKYSNTIVVTHTFLKSLLPEKAQSKVVVMPTTDGDMVDYLNDGSVQINRLQSLRSKLVVVWVATSGNMPNLIHVLPYIDEAANKLNKSGVQLVLKVICNKPVDYSAKYLVIENIEWTRQRAIDEMALAHLGIMPLDNTEYNKGKGGFKLVQYLSIGLPCIASNVGFNNEVVDASCGVLVEGNENWGDAFESYINPDVWKASSIAAKQKWERCFSYEKNLLKWKEILDA